jgi:hypothetical protein
MRDESGSVAAGEWMAVEIAPLSGNERWRFVVTMGGKGVVEKHTRAGRFRIEGLQWKCAAKNLATGYGVEMEIPLSVIGDPQRFRFNALRRVNDLKAGIRHIARAHQDAGDVSLMPVATLAAPPTATQPKPMNRQDRQAS